MRLSIRIPGNSPTEKFLRNRFASIESGQNGLTYPGSLIFFERRECRAGLLQANYRKITAMTDPETNKTDQLRRAIKELSVLNDIAMAINISMSTEKIAEIIVKYCTKHVMASQGAIFLIDELSKSIEDFKTFIRSKSLSITDVSFHLNKLIIGWMIRHKKNLLCNDPKSDSRFNKVDFEKQGIFSFLAVPLLERRNLIGILTVFNKENQDKFNDEDSRFLAIVGSQVAKVLENARLFEREKKFISELNQQRLQSMAKLTAGIAHEFNTPMGAIISSANLITRAVTNLRGVFEKDPEMVLSGDVEKFITHLASSAGVIEDGGAKMKNLVKRLKSFAQLDQSELQTADLNRCMEDCLTMLESRIGDGIEVIKRYNAESNVLCYPAQLNQVFFEVLLNAIEAMPEKGKLEISTCIAKDELFVEIADSGEGISLKDNERVFEPGFTTKGVKVGVGLGLPICYQIVKSHQGDIEIKSEPGEGTKVIIKLPTDLRQPLI